MGTHRSRLFAAIHYLSRALSIIFALFLGLFALDVFGEGASFVESIVAFAIHLLPTYLVIGALIVAWRWPIPGGLCHIALALPYIVLSGMREHWDWSLIIGGPPVLIGILFIVDGVIRRRHDSPSASMSRG